MHTFLVTSVGDVTRVYKGLACYSQFFQNNEGDSPVNFIFVLLLGSCSQDQRPGKILVFRDYFVSGNNQLLLSLKQDITLTEIFYPHLV